MTIVERLASALGPPRAFREVAEGGRFLGAVGRWRHEGAQVDLSGTDTVQVIFNVSGGQQVELRSPAGFFRRTVRAGSINIVASSPATRVTVTGRADTVQIILGRALLASPTTGRLLHLSVGEARLQAAGVQALMGLSRSHHDNSRLLEAVVRQVGGWLAAASVISPPSHARGGLSPAARRRVGALLDARLQADGCSPLAVDELAQAAGLSLHHFIKAFRQTEGDTPHAKIVARRLDLALSLLLRANARVDWIAMQTGFYSPAHFVSTFRRHLSITPGALRDAVNPRW